MRRNGQAKPKPEGKKSQKARRRTHIEVPKRHESDDDGASMEDEDLEFFAGQGAQAASFLGNLDERGISL